MFDSTSPLPLPPPLSRSPAAAGGKVTRRKTPS